ncbi:hypothetical protein ACFU99_38265, partial [Streptomyces sp. NPDC057654]|uniref:hypothetical protein n=1 Tax=Streptomyces sp. NPDC057654 TaxID=3346196 RepID=UPI00368F64D7
PPHLLTHAVPGRTGTAGHGLPERHQPVNLPVDNATLASWSALLGLTEQQTTAALARIEQNLRTGYEYRPKELRDMTFEQLTGDMDAHEAALMFLISGLHQAGYPEAAYAIEARGIGTALQQTS